MWIARDKNGTLKIYESVPYLQLNLKKLVTVDREEYVHDRWCNIDKPIGDVMEPFWFSVASYYEQSWSGSYTITFNMDNRGKIIHPSLFSEITFENSPYNIADLCFLTPEEKEKHTIDNEKKYLE